MSEIAPYIGQSLKWSSDVTELLFSWLSAGSSQHSQRRGSFVLARYRPKSKQTT